MFDLIIDFGYIGIFLTIIGEIGFMIFPLPGDTLLFSAGILTDNGHFDYLTLLLTCVTASVIGGHIGYYIGTKIDKETLINNKYYRIKDEHLHKTEKFFEKYGVWAIIFSRYVPVVRSFLSPFLGIIGYDRKKFFYYNIISSILWPLLIVTAGMFIGKMFPNLLTYLEYLIAFLFILVSVPIFKEIIHQRRTRFNK